MVRIFKEYIVVLTITCVALFSDACSEKPGRTTATTLDISGLTQTSAVSAGRVTGKGGSVTGKGFCWGTTENPTFFDNVTRNGSDTGRFVNEFRSLQPATTYFVRTYATSRSDTVYGNTVSFSTLDYGTLADSEGNSYRSINIGSQVWMAENLRTTRLNDGKSIPVVENEKAWAGLSSPAYCWYNNDEEGYKSLYGALYNWYSVGTGKLCPLGWHVPSDREWSILADFLGDENYAGGKLKDTGITYWVEPNTGATNEYCFTALPGGFRHSNGKFFDFGFSGYWWSSGEYSGSRAWFRFLYYNETVMYRFNNLKKNGFSVRCIQD